MGEQGRDLQDAEPAQAVILVVDDIELNRDLLTRRLARKGFATNAASDDFTALEWLANHHCDLVLLDIMMPGMSGIEVLKKVRETRDGTELPIIMATARDTREDIVAALGLGANDYVTKPLDFPVVLARVNAQLEMKRANDRVRQLVREVGRRNEFIRSVFGRYLTDDIVETLLDSPEGLKLGGERREITILMADIRGFTKLSSHLEPEQVITLVNNFLSEMTPVIISRGGTIDEFIGDAILALFGAPRAMEDHAEKAVACALEMQEAMLAVNDLNRQSGMPDLSMGIGINTGEVIVGNIGSEQRAKYGVVGHNVNFAARVESYTVGGQILVSDRTLEACAGLLETRGEMNVRPKGFDEDERIHDICGIGGSYQISI